MCWTSIILSGQHSANRIPTPPWADSCAEKNLNLQSLPLKLKMQRDLVFMLGHQPQSEDCVFDQGIPTFDWEDFVFDEGAPTLDWGDCVLDQKTLTFDWEDCIFDEGP